MRKLLLGALSCVGLLASCDKNEENPGWSIQLETMNLITPASGDPYAAKGKYVFKFNSEDATLAIAGSDLNLGGHNVKFSTPESKYDANFYQEGSIYSFSFPSGTIASSAAELKNMKGILTTIYYLPEDLRDQNPSVSPLAIMKYEIGSDYTVRTFPQSAFFSGRTKTTFTTANGAGGTFSSDAPLYKVYIDPVKNEAEVFMINAKFAEQMPMMNLLLKGLKVKFVSDGYIITGADIIPEMVGETSTVPNPNFPFKSFKFMTVSDDMVSATASFRVGDRFSGEFSGAYMPK